MTTDPKDVEIARLRQQWDEHDAAWSERVAVLTAAQHKAEAERDAALAQVAMAYDTASQVEGYRYNTWGDKLPTKLSYSQQEAIRALTPADALAALSRRDAQMRAEGLRRALDVVSENADWPEDEHGRTEYPALFARISNAILAAAEKEAGDG